MQFNIRSATMLAGIGCAAGGVLVNYGVGWALCAVGALLIGMALIG